MPDAPMTRRQMLEEFLAANPNDAFARYGLALECANAGDTSAADGHFRKLIAEHPAYVPSYYHFGQLLLRAGNKDEARTTFQAGVQAARKAGDAHAQSELEAALEEVASGV